MDAQEFGHAAKRAAADQVDVGIVDFLQAGGVQEQYRERPAIAVGAFGLALQNVKQPAIIRQAGERIAYREMVHLFKQVRVVPQRTAKRNRVAEHSKSLRKHEGSIKQAFGLAGSKLRRQIEPASAVDGAIEHRVFHLQPAAIPDQRQKKNCGRQELLRAGNDRTGMRGHSHRQVPQGGGNQIRQAQHGEESAAYFEVWMAGTRQKMLNDQSDGHQKNKHHSARPQSKGCPNQMDRLVLQEFQEENTGSGQDRAGEKKTRAEDQRNAVLCSLKANEGHGGENKFEQGGDDFQIALQNRVRVDW